MLCLVLSPGLQEDDVADVVVEASSVDFAEQMRQRILERQRQLAQRGVIWTYSQFRVHVRTCHTHLVRLVVVTRFVCVWGGGDDIRDL